MGGVSIGIVNISYCCKPTLDLAFNPWREVKNGVLKGLVSDVWISSKHCCFPETFSLGYDLYSKDGTLEKLGQFKEEGLVDDFEIYDEPIEEQIAWSDNLPFLQSKNPELIWMTNSDEIFTVNDIARIVEFVQRNSLTDYFKVNFKNYFGRGKFVDNFVVPRVWANKRNGGLKLFYRDDLAQFNNGKKDVECSSMVIPKKHCFPAHYSWSLPPQYSDEENKLFCMRKLGFQKIRYIHPSYRWNDEKNELELDPTYYSRFGLTMPQVFNEA
jgi:hypothetical protein